MAWFDEYVQCRDVWLDEHTRRRMREWRRGAVVTLGAADRLMCLLGEHLSVLPDDIWAAPPSRRPRRPRRPPPSNEQRLEAVRKVRAGIDKNQVAAEYGVTRAALCRWLRIFP